MSHRIVHMCMSVRGVLGWPRREQKRMAPGWIVDGKRLKTADDLREFLMDCLAAGKEVIPMADDCEGFDYKTGCPGHVVEDEATP